MSTGPTLRPVARVSPRRYFARRVGVGVVLGLLVLGAARLVSGVLGGDDGLAVGTADTVSDAVDVTSGGSVSVAGDPAAGDPAPGGPTGDSRGSGDGAVDPPAAGPDPTEQPSVAAANGADPTEARPAPSPDHPARILIVGDSDAGTFGPYLQQLLNETRVVETRLDYKVSSGLARPDFFDWHEHLESIVPAFDPDIVVVTFGGNDGQFLANRSGGVVVPQPRPDSENAEWTAEYRARVARILDYLLAEGRTVVWVGIPNHVDPAVTFRMQLQDEAVKAEVAEHPEVLFVDAWSRFAGRRGGFAEFVIDPRDGIGKAVRASDGFHLNQVGAEILAIDISQVVFDELRARGAAI